MEHSESVYRDIQFPIASRVYLNEDYLLKQKTESQAYLIDILDRQMMLQGESEDEAISLLSTNLNLNKVHSKMRELTPEEYFKKNILTKMNSRFDLFYWRKKYAQSI